MRYLAIFSILCLVLIAGKCKKKEEVKMALLQKTWLHSHEDDQGDVRVYRPNTYNFPPSRGRTGFAFEPNGQFRQYDIAPADGLEEHIGKWELLENGDIQVSFDKEENRNYKIELISVEPEMLKIKRHFD